MGIPFLQIPEPDILARGSTDVDADLALQRRTEVTAGAGTAAIAATSDFGRHRPPSARAGTTPSGEDLLPWTTVLGEVFTFNDPETRLPAIDALEDAHSHGPHAYRRVLAPVTVAGRGAAAAWLYIMERAPAGARFFPGGRWPA
jgi:hypothetical protein